MIEDTRSFISESDKFLCGFGKYALKAGKLHLACLPEFRLEGRGLDGTLNGRLAYPSAPDNVQAVIREAFRLYKKEGLEGIVFIDPNKSREHLTAYNRTWTLYAEIGLATLKLFPVNFADMTVLNYPDSEIRPNIYELSSRFGSQSGMVDYKEEGQLYDGESNLHYFSLNGVYPLDHPRYAPVNLYVITNLGKVTRAKEATLPNGDKVGLNTVVAMHKNQVKRCVRPYNGDLPYVFPDDARFDPLLLRTIINETHAMAQRMGINRELADRACFRLYYQLNADHLEINSHTTPEEIQAGFLKMLIV